MGRGGEGVLDLMVTFTVIYADLVLAVVFAVDLEALPGEEMSLELLHCKDMYGQRRTFSLTAS